MINWLLKATLLLSFLVFIEPAPYDLGMVLVLTVMLFTLEYSREMRALLLVVFVFFVVQLISNYFSPAFSSSLLYNIVTIYIIIGAIFFVSASERYFNNYIDTILFYYLFAALANCFFVLSFPFFNIGDSLFGRPMGFFKDPNVMASYCVPASVYALFKYLSGSSKLYLFSFVVILTTILIGLSRAAYLNLIVSCLGVVCLLVFFSTSEERISKGRVLTLILLFLGAVLSIIIVFPFVLDILSDRVEIKAYDSDRFRGQYLSMKNATFFGSGAITSESMIGQSTHSLYLRQLYEHGFLGFFLMLFVLFLPFFRLKDLLLQKNLALVIVFSCYVGQLVNSLVIDTIHWRHLWLLWAIIIVGKHGKYNT